MAQPAFGRIFCISEQRCIWLEFAVAIWCPMMILDCWLFISQLSPLMSAPRNKTSNNQKRPKTNQQIKNKKINQKREQ
jgi:hypothetical protein